MRKRVILALMLVAVMLLSGGCRLIAKDAEVDRQTPVIEVLGKVYTKGEVNEQVAATLDYQEYIYAMLYGQYFDKTNPLAIAESRANVVDALIRRTVLENKVVELGLTLTEEETSALEASVAETYKGYVESIKTAYFEDTELTGEELEQAVAAKMGELGYPTQEVLFQEEEQQKIQESLRADRVKDCTVTEEEVKDLYELRVADAKANYEMNPTAYGSAVNSGATIYYTPEGYRYVKHILRKISEEDAAVITELEGKLSEIQARLTSADASLASLDEDAEQDTEEDAKNRTQWMLDKAAAESEWNAADLELMQAKETAYANLQPAVDEILQKLAEGADFDALMEEYGEDTGMQTSPSKETGYLVCEGDTQYVAEFTAAAMALENVGDISPAVRSSFGIHILTYASNAVEGVKAFETVQDTLQRDLLAQKQEEFYTELENEWIKEANPKMYLNRLDD